MFFKRKMKHMYMFHVGYLRYKKEEKPSRKATAIINNISTFIIPLFTQLRDEEEKSVMQALPTGNWFFVFGLNSQNQKNYSSNFVFSNRFWNLD